MLSVSEFVHLHVHTEYSLLDGMIRIKDLIKQAEKFQMPSVAITDHGNMFGAVKFYQECQKVGIKPIIGCEVYVAPVSRGKKDSVGNHLVLLCKNGKGYKNLCRLVSAGYTEGFYYKPRIDMEILRECGEGLIALSACLKGSIPQALLEDNEDTALARAREMLDIFGDRFYLELQENGIEDQRRVNRGLISIGKQLGIGLAATNDCHYLKKENARAHEALLCIQTQKLLSDENRMRLSTDEFYFKSPGEMKERFAEVPEAVANTGEIAKRCNFDWDLKTKHFPLYRTEEGMTLDEMLIQQTNEGFEKRLGDFRKSDPRYDERVGEYKKRLDYELGVIQEMGFPGYFLIVADFINKSRERGIAVGPGRGSAAGSLVSYCLGITDLNPIAYGLIFERFLNPERREMPDIDVDFCQERREEALHYVTETYGGHNHVAQIITFGTMKARAVVRDVGRVLEVPYGEVDRLAKLIPANATLEEAMEQEPRLKEVVDGDSRFGELWTYALALEGISRHASVHAAGVVISDKPLTHYLPLYKDQKEDKVVAQYDKKCVEKVGLIKFDLLGLKTLTQIRYCLELIRENRGEEVNVDKLGLGDKETYALFSRGDTTGVFQLESSGMKDLLTRLMPDCFEEMIAVVALYRPGPLGSGYHIRFIERKHGREAVEYALPELKDILSETYGVLVYQEQVMEIAVVLAKYSMGEADSLRKAMGKKDQALMDAQQEKFMAGAEKAKIDKAKAAQVFEDMKQFAKYGFNKSHAAAYALVSYQTAYLKAHYPAEFLASLCTMDIDYHEKIEKYLAECEDKGFEVLPPHVNKSLWKFGVDGEKVVFGLGAVKGVGKAAVEALIEAREEGGEFRSIFDFCERVDPKKANRKALESLIKAGAFDGLGAHRAQLMAALDKAVEQGNKASRERDSGQTSLFDMLGEESGSDFIAEHYPEASEWTSQEMLANEKEALGYYLTGHPLGRFEKTMKTYGVTETTRVPFAPNGQDVLIGGLVTHRKEILNKKKERMAFVTITDLKGSIEVVVFSNVYQDALEFLENTDEPVLIKGRAEISEDKAKILASEVLPLGQAVDRLSLTLHVTLRRPDIGQEQVDRLGSILKSHSGKARVMVHVRIPDRSETVIALPAQLRAHPGEELIAALEEFLGEGSVRLDAA